MDFYLGLAGRGLAGRGLAGRGLAGRWLAGRGLAGRGLAGRGLAGRGLAGRGLAGRGLADLEVEVLVVAAAEQAVGLALGAAVEVVRKQQPYHHCQRPRYLPGCYPSLFS